MARPLLVSWKNEIEMFGIKDGVKDGQNGTAGVPN